jgi:hypothetical protein
LLFIEENKKMSLTELFKNLGAPLNNNRWSWGAVSPDGVVFLRVWDDEKKKINGKSHVRVTAYDYFKGKPNDNGWKERLRHLELIKQGAQSYMVICFAKDVNASPREINTYSNRMLWKAGNWIEHDGDIWLEIEEAVPVKLLTLEK